MLESQFILTEKKILDHQLNIEVALDMKKKNNTKLIKEKLINEFQNQKKKIKIKIKKAMIKRFYSKIFKDNNIFFSVMRFIQ